MWTQLILVALLGAVLFILLRSKPNARQLALGRIGLLIAILAGIVVVLAPGWLTSIANFFGIGRGPDLLLYVLIIVFLMKSASDYKKNIALARQNTKLARAVALLEQRVTSLEAMDNEE